jgi:hypothetical protein
MAKKKPTTRSSRGKRSRRAAATASKELVATVKSSALYKVLRDEGIKKKKANRIVRAATAPVRAAVGVVEALPSAPTAPPPAAPPATKTAAKKTAAKKTVRKAATKATKRTAAPASLENLTKAELLARARTANVAGRSGMSKDQLIAALRRS